MVSRAFSSLGSTILGCADDTSELAASRPRRPRGYDGTLSAFADINRVVGWEVGEWSRVRTPETGSGVAGDRRGAYTCACPAVPPETVRRQASRP
jgi:hypothetical protein